MAKQKETDYLFIATRLRSLENRLLTRERMERMLEARTNEDAAKVLSECGYQGLEPLTAQALEHSLAAARQETFSELAAMAPNPQIVDVFRMKYDYHNAKACLLYTSCIVEGLMNGTSATTFEPDSATDRAMLVTGLYRLEGQPEAGDGPFTDVRAGEWDTDAITWAAENKIVEGYGDGTFGPEDSITREQFATILYRYAKYKGYDVSAKADITTFCLLYTSR